jgi:hypothetical protein
MEAAFVNPGDDRLSFRWIPLKPTSVARSHPPLGDIEARRYIRPQVPPYLLPLERRRIGCVLTRIRFPGLRGFFGSSFIRVA